MAWLPHSSEKGRNQCAEDKRDCLAISAVPFFISAISVCFFRCTALIMGIYLREGEKRMVKIWNVNEFKHREFQAVQAAVDACARAGGGMVAVPEGEVGLP